MSDIPETLRHLETAKGKERSKIAHRLKGASAHFGLVTFCAALDQVEKTPEDPDGHLIEMAMAAGRGAVASLAASLETEALQTSEAGSTNR